MISPMPTTVVEGIRLAYVDKGSGDPVILLHGWGGQAASMMPLIVALETRYRVLAFDLPGFGESNPPPEPWGTPEYAEFVWKAAKSLGIVCATYVGHSFGGRVAIWLAAHHPEAVQALVLIDAAGIRQPATPGRRVRSFFYKAGKAVLRLPFWRSRTMALQERLATRFGSPDYRATSGVMRGTFVKTVTLDLLPCLPDIRVPTLLLWGDKDEETPLSDGKTMECLIPESRLIVVAGAGHFSYLDKPAFVGAVVSAFVDGTRGPKTT
ncbi:MAG TPA: alpha/beta hydrolase [Candidatus Cryosericum sp.]